MGNYEYQAMITDWIDGDTCDVELDLGFGFTFKPRLRVYGLNTPETRSSDPAEKAAGQAARAKAVELAPLYSRVMIRSHKPHAELEREKFGRWLAMIELADGSDFTIRMLAAGHGKPYFGEKRT